MPDLSQMKCNICDDIFPAEELAAHEGMCIACADVMNPLAEKDEQGVLDDEGGLASDEMRSAIERYRKRQAYQKKYNERPKAQEARKAYNKNRQERDRMLIRKAKEQGLL